MARRAPKMISVPGFNAPKLGVTTKNTAKIAENRRVNARRLSGDVAAAKATKRAQAAKVAKMGSPGISKKGVRRDRKGRFA